MDGKSVFVMYENWNCDLPQGKTNIAEYFDVYKFLKNILNLGVLSLSSAECFIACSGQSTLHALDMYFVTQFIVC